MFLLDRLFVSGLRFVLDTLVTTAEAETADDPARVREELLELQLRHEAGEIEDEELARREADLMERLRALRGAAGPLAAAAPEDLAGAEVVVEAFVEGER